MYHPQPSATVRDRPLCHGNRVPNMSPKWMSYCIEINSDEYVHTERVSHLPVRGRS